VVRPNEPSLTGTQRLERASCACSESVLEAPPAASAPRISADTTNTTDCPSDVVRRVQPKIEVLTCSAAPPSSAHSTPAVAALSPGLQDPLQRNARKPAWFLWFAGRGGANTCSVRPAI